MVEGARACARVVHGLVDNQHKLKFIAGQSSNIMTNKPVMPRHRDNEMLYVRRVI